MRTTYRNSDLDLISSSQIDELIAAFENGDRYHVLFYEKQENGKWYSIIESAIEGEWGNTDVEESSLQPNRIPENHIQLMLDKILNLTGKAKAQWNQCDKREFNIGYDFGETRCFQQFLSEKLVQQISQAGCSLGITMYNMPE